MQFSLKLVKITAYAGPRKQNVLHYKTSSGHRQPKLTFRAVGRYKLVLRNTRPLRIL